MVCSSYLAEEEHDGGEEQSSSQEWSRTVAAQHAGPDRLVSPRPVVREVGRFQPLVVVCLMFGWGLLPHLGRGG